MGSRASQDGPNKAGMMDSWSKVWPAWWSGGPRLVEGTRAGIRFFFFFFFRRQGRTLGAMRTTLMSGRKSTPSFCMTPSRKPWESPSVAPDFMPANSRGYSFAWARPTSL